MKVDPKKDYYRILQVSPSAGPRTLRASFRRLAKTYHPDVSMGTHPTRKMQHINEAYSVLSDPRARHTYDALRARAAALQADRASSEDAPKGPPPTPGGSSSPPAGASAAAPSVQDRAKESGLNRILRSPWPTIGILLFIVLGLLPGLASTPLGSWAQVAVACMAIPAVLVFAVAGFAYISLKRGH